MKKRVLIPMPTYGSDPTEVAIPWSIMVKNDFEVVFATPNGEKAESDRIMLYGDGLGMWKSILKARKDALDQYFKLEKDQAFCHPIQYSDIQESDFDALFLPGGHDKSMKEYLESPILQNVVVDFFRANKSVGAICHGVVLAARSIDPKTKKSVLYNYKTTSLLKKQEMLAYNLTKRNLKDYYLTYPGLTVEDEVKSVLQTSKNYLQGPTPIFRDSMSHLKRGFVVKDRNYISARWPGDAYSFSLAFVEMNEVLK